MIEVLFDLYSILKTVFTVLGDVPLRVVPCLTKDMFCLVVINRLSAQEFEESISLKIEIDKIDRRR